MNTSDTTSVRKEFLALLERGRQIKARRQKEAEAWLAERRRRQEEAAHLWLKDMQDQRV